MPTPSELSRDLRRRTDPDLRRRRWLVGLSLLGVAIGQVVTLYQTGIIRRLPDPPLGPFDSERVNASDYAYKRLQVPDAVLMIATYAITAALAAAGGRNRAEEQPVLPVALAAKTFFDVGTNLKLAQEEWADNKALCAYCQTASLVSIASLALALPEAARALRNLLGR
ncbi:vitamin K epoxide reductase family protein [Roseomonas sp. GCM10028921]